MSEQEFTWGGVLRVVFNTVSASPAQLAEFYIDRDRTLVYRWLRDEAAPPAKLLPQVVRFVMDNSLEAERVRIKAEMDAYIDSSRLDMGIKDSLASEDDFESYIDAVLRIALAERRSRKRNRGGTAGVATTGGAAAGVATTGGGTAPRALPTGTGFTAGAAAGTAVATYPHRSIPLVAVAFAVTAAVAGGLIWTLLNQLLGWTFYLGGSGNEPADAFAFVWGLTLGAPVIALCFLSIRVERLPLQECLRCDWRLAVILYTLVAGAAALLFYNSGFRGFIERQAYAYALQETVIVVVFALLLSLPPMIMMLALLRPKQIERGPLAAVLSAPVFMSACCVLVTMLIGGPEAELAQLRGFTIGLVLRISMFVALRWVFSRAPA